MTEHVLFLSEESHIRVMIESLGHTETIVLIIGCGGTCLSLRLRTISKGLLVAMKRLKLKGCKLLFIYRMLYSLLIIGKLLLRLFKD
jgi:hypothetical protein